MSLPRQELALQDAVTGQNNTQLCTKPARRDFLPQKLADELIKCLFLDQVDAGQHFTSHRSV